MDLYPFPIIETIFNSRAFKFDTIEVVSANFDISSVFCTLMEYINSGVKVAGS